MSIQELDERKKQLKRDLKKYEAEKNYKQLDGAEIELAQIGQKLYHLRLRSHDKRATTSNQ